MVLQPAVVFPTTLRENIAYGRPQATRAEIEECARAAQAHEFISELADGYHMEITKWLSGPNHRYLFTASVLRKSLPIPPAEIGIVAGNRSFFPTNS